MRGGGDPTIRAMRHEDAAAVAEMARELAAAVGDAEPGLSASDLVRDGLGQERWFECMVAEVDGELVGYVLMCKGFEAHIGKRRLWLGDLHVRAAARRNGVGTALMAAVARHALALDCEAVYWDLWRMNALGGAFYRKLRAEEITDLAIMRLDTTALSAIAAA
jgi:GNAT superfamily N-acetyltransferase